MKLYVYAFKFIESFDFQIGVSETKPTGEHFPKFALLKEIDVDLGIDEFTQDKILALSLIDLDARKQKIMSDAVRRCEQLGE